MSDRLALVGEGRPKEGSMMWPFRRLRAIGVTRCDKCNGTGLLLPGCRPSALSISQCDERSHYGNGGHCPKCRACRGDGAVTVWVRE